MSTTYICYLLNLIETFPSTISSLTVMMLIIDMRIWNGSLMLIFYMSFFQLWYDMSLFVNNTASSNSINGIWSTILQLYGGTTAAIISNELSITVLLIVLRRKSLDPLRHWKILMLIANLPAASICLIYLTGLNSSSQLYTADIYYYYLRLISIFLNFMSYMLTSAIIYRMNPSHCFSSSVREKSIQERAISTLVQRMKYYPMVQTISRIGYAWYEFKYGFDFVPTNPTGLQQGALILVAALTPLAAVGYLAIFLLLQPHAATHLWQRLCTCRRPVRATTRKRGGGGGGGVGTIFTSAGEGDGTRHVLTDMHDLQTGTDSLSQGQGSRGSMHYNLQLDSRETEELCRVIDYCEEVDRGRGGARRGGAGSDSGTTSMGQKTSLFFSSSSGLTFLQSSVTVTGSNSSFLSPVPGGGSTSISGLQESLSPVHEADQHLDEL